MKYFSIVSWNDYQHGSGKTREYPWIKLYGSLFRRHWFVSMAPEFRYLTVCLLDYSRENNNKIPLDLKTFFRIYHLDFNLKKSETWFNSLISNDFIASKKLVDCYPNATPNRVEKSRVDKTREEKSIYADFVTLTPSEFDSLVKKFGNDNAQQRISDLNLWKGSKGKKTKSDYMTILSWERHEEKKQQSFGERKSFDELRTERIKRELREA